jgi:hypothetical protein
MMRGMPVPEVAYDAFAWIKTLYVKSEKVGSTTVDLPLSEDLRQPWAALKEHYMFKKEGITPEELRARFWIGRTGEKASLPTRSNDPPGNPPVTIALRMIQILWDWIIFGIKLLIWCFVPANAVAEAAANVGVEEIRATEKAALRTRLEQLESLQKKQSGGAQPLSTEAQIMGATVIALIAGGSLKGLVDYLMKE